MSEQTRDVESDESLLNAAGEQCEECNRHPALAPRPHSTACLLRTRLREVLAERDALKAQIAEVRPCPACGSRSLIHNCESVPIEEMRDAQERMRHMKEVHAYERKRWEAMIEGLTKTATDALAMQSPTYIIASAEVVEELKKRDHNAD